LRFLADGVASRDVFPLDIPRAIRKLQQIKPHIKVWPDSGNQQEQIMVNREVGIQYLWNGRAYVLKKKALSDLQLIWE
jgi:spermidine/putrescine-binding protein